MKTFGLTEVTSPPYNLRDYPTVPFGSYAWMHGEVKRVPDYPSVPQGIMAYQHAEVTTGPALHVQVIDAASGYPINCAAVAVEDGRIAVTDGNGVASMPVVAGPHSVAAGAPGYDDDQQQIVSGSADYDLTIALSPAGSGIGSTSSQGLARGTVTGNVVDGDTGVVIPGAFLTVDAGSTPSPVSATGEFSLSLAPGAHVLTGHASGYVNEAYAVVVSATAPVDGSLLMYRTGSPNAASASRGALLPLVGIGAAVALLALL